MSERQRMYIFFFGGARHLEKFLAILEEEYGALDVVALVPRNNRESRADRKRAEFRRLRSSRFGLGAMPGLLLSALQLRRERPDCMLIFYDSLKQRLFAALAGPRRCIWARADGYHVDLPPGVLGILFDLLRNRVRGIGMILRVYFNVHFRGFRQAVGKDSES